MIFFSAGGFSEAFQELAGDDKQLCLVTLEDMFQGNM